jgi:hypothetical protein
MKYLLISDFGAMEARRRPELLATNHTVYEQYRQATQRELVRMGLADDPP